MTSDISAYLRSDTLVNDQVSSRVYWLQAPQKPTMPYVSYFETADPHREFTFNNINSGQPIIMVNVYDDNKYRCLSIGNVIRGRLERYQGAMNNSTVEYLRCGGTYVSKVPDHDFYRGTFEAEVYYYDT